MRDGYRVNSESNTLLPGDLVRVLSVEEILSTLDEQGTLDHLPFMPEMIQFAGRTFRVSRQAFKTCVDDQEMRQLERTVLLDKVRCDGSSHGGCGKACLIFWKEDWLRRVSPATSSFESSESRKNGNASPKLDRATLTSLAISEDQFFCQSSEIINASKPLPWWHVRQYFWDLKYNQIPFLQWLKSLFIACYNKVAYVGRFPSWNFIAGPGETIVAEQPLNLLPGELVRVKSLKQIRATLDSLGKNQNLLFAPSMAEFCGCVLRVEGRVDNIVLEGSRRQRKIKDTVLLEGATCDGICHRMCPRQSFLFWRECWLERI